MVGRHVMMVARILGLAMLLMMAGQTALAGDYLNEQEVERVREAQEIDKRTAVFIRIADRRLAVLTGEPLSEPVKNKKDKKDKKDKENENSNDYGPPPTGSTTELLDSYSKVMSELLDKIDDTNERKKNDPALPKAMAKLLTATEAHISQLEQLRRKIRSSGEEMALEKAMEIAKMANDGARGFKVQ